MRRARADRRHGFTLIEMLVVIAISAILMGLILIPVGHALNLTARARALVSAQDALRTAMRRMVRELSQAMVILLPAGPDPVAGGTPDALALYHYSQYDPPTDRPTPSETAVPVTHLVRDGMIAFMLPKHRYYCTDFDHYLLDNEVPPNAAIDTCPRTNASGTLIHPNSPVQLVPMQPMQPEPILVLYFIGLREPRYPQLVQTSTPPPGDPAAPGPRYVSPLFQNLVGEFNNPYTLYRVEARLAETMPATGPLANLFQRSSGGALRRGVNGDPLINPTFFYDPTAASTGRPFATEWRLRAVPLLRTDDKDVVQLKVTRDGIRPLPLVRFNAAVVENDLAHPDRRTAVPVPSPAPGVPGLATSDLPPVRYVTKYGHWAGVRNDGRTLYFRALITDPSNGPRIVITAGGAVVFDSASNLPALRRRMFAYHSERGELRFAIPRRHDPDGSGAGSPLDYWAQVQPDFTVDLKQDLAVSLNSPYLPESVPTGLGSALNAGLPARLVPFSETVIRVMDSTTGVTRRYRRVGWVGLGNNLDRPVAQADLGVDEYAVDYRNGLLFFSDEDTSLLNTGPGNSIRQQLLVRYEFQTNTIDDVVRVTYRTRELIDIALGVVQYVSQTNEGLPVQLTQRVRVRNLSR